MQEWFERLLKELIWKAIADAINALAEWTEAQIEAKLAELTPASDPLSKSPLIKVLETTDTTITFFIRGRIKLFAGAESAFMRIEVVVSKDVDLSFDGPPISILDWLTVVGELKLKKKKVFEAKVGLGYDEGVWFGRGALKILPAGFGLDIFLGGFNDRGAMIGLDADFPSPIPLGSTGLCLNGIGGDFAYNFIPRLESGGVPVANPTAVHYVGWARNNDIDRWQAGPIDETAVGVGIRADFATLPDNGRVMKLEPIGLAVLTPGPVFLLGGTGKLLNTSSAKIEGYLGVDIASKSLALGFGVRVKIPKSGSKTLMDAKGTLAAFFSFSDASLWYINLGTNKKPVKAKVLADLLRAEIFFMINNNRVTFGAGISIGGEWCWSIFCLIARLGVRVAALIGWNPVELAGAFELWGELGIKVWKFKFLLSGSAKAIGHTPEPTQLDFVVKFKLGMPWPIPDIEGSTTLSYSDADPVGPPLSSPLLVGESTVAGTTTAGPMQLGGIHALSGRQWLLGEGTVWPDVEIVIPFNRRPIDETGTAIGNSHSPEMQGGYEVLHRITSIELRDLINDVVVPNVKGVWVAGPGGDVANLHILGNDPFSWLTPHPTAPDTATISPPKFVEQRFGSGPELAFDSEYRFDELLVDPLEKATLLNEFQPNLPTRVLRSEDFDLKFRTRQDDPIRVDRLRLYIIAPKHSQSELKVSPSENINISYVREVYGHLHLWAVQVSLLTPITEINIASAMDNPLLVYAVRYREAAYEVIGCPDKQILVPGQYRIRLEGNSTAEHGDGTLPASTPVCWNVVKDFNVDFPESLRPYILFTTLGDSRLFFEDAILWNPTMYGIGFPAYKQYHAMVRFRVPYIDHIFSTIKMRLSYENGTIINHVATPVANPDGTSSLLDISQDWLTEAGCTVQPDQEIQFPSPLPERGPAKLALLFDHPDGREIKLEEWSCYISQFNTFSEHLFWDSDCIQTYYNASGRTSIPCCPALATPEKYPDYTVWNIGNRIDNFDYKSESEFDFKKIEAPLLDVIYPVDDSSPFPEELNSPPVNWILPTELAEQINELDSDTSARFGRFAKATGVRFNDGGLDKLSGINDTTATTTIEAIVDEDSRPYALWLRTPEPVDWRRVSLALRIRHVTQPDECPTGYAHRTPLDLEIKIIPSPDATSAFLIGEFKDVPIFLPRGEYQLTLTFDPDTSQLNPLQASSAVTTVPEIIILKFIQPRGSDWPLKRTGILIPAELLEQLTLQFNIDPFYLREMFQQPIPGSDKIFEKRDMKIPRTQPSPDFTHEKVPILTEPMKKTLPPSKVGELTEEIPDVETQPEQTPPAEIRETTGKQAQSIKDSGESEKKPTKQTKPKTTKKKTRGKGRQS